jgi:hypothetical protein
VGDGTVELGGDENEEESRVDVVLSVEDLD